tara:strand:+ start:422 stop:706 length:285 start_codon:yes stop_codon:yes gene_type:complete
MWVKVLFQAFVIGIVSMGLYAIFTKSSQDPVYNPQYSQDPVYDPQSYENSRKQECLRIGGIVFGVAVFFLVVTNKSQALVKESPQPTLNHKPPF